MQPITYIAHLATYPGREKLLAANMPRIVTIFGRVLVCLNGFDEVPAFLRGDERIVPFMPESDLKDTGKFIDTALGSDTDFFIDDDLIYPFDYTDRMRHYATMLPSPAVLGVHGVNFLEGYRGGVAGREVHDFRSALTRFVEVDCLGTGTVMLSGIQAPSFTYMKTSAGFVDVRFAKYCAENALPRICVPRHALWLRERRHSGPTLFSDFTSRENRDVLNDVEVIRSLRGAHRNVPLTARLSRFDRIKFRASMLISFGLRVQRVTLAVARAVWRRVGTTTFRASHQ